VPIKDVSENAVYSFFLSGHFCIVRGYYCLREYLPEELIQFPFFEIIDSPYVFLEIEKNKEVLFFDYEGFIEVRALQAMERFIFGRVLTYAFAVADGQERPFACQKWVHHFWLEIFWATAPAVIIILIVIPSLALLYSTDAIRHCDHSVRITANQWFWNYAASNINNSKYYNSYIFEFSTENSLRNFVSLDRAVPFDSNQDTILFSVSAEFDSYLLSDANLSNGSKRLLDTDRHLIVPSFRALRFFVSSVDVLHSFSLPSIGIKVDAVTGRLNAVTFFPVKEGILLGQCSELCGSGHMGMPIALEIIEPFDHRSYLEYIFWSDSNINIIGYNSLLTIDENLVDIDFSEKKEEEDFFLILEIFLK